MIFDEYDRYIPKGFDWHEASRLVQTDQDIETDTSLVGIWFHPRLPERRSDEATGQEAEGK